MREGPTSNDWCPYKREIWTRAHGRDAHTPEKVQEARHHQKRAEARQDPPLESSEGARPTDTFTVDFWLWGLRE